MHVSPFSPFKLRLVFFQSLLFPVCAAVGLNVLECFEVVFLRILPPTPTLVSGHGVADPQPADRSQP